MKLQELAQHLLNLDPQRSPGRLAFYHYLKNFRHLDENLTAEVVASFYQRAMQFPQWQGAAMELGQVVAGDLEPILDRQGLLNDFKYLRHANQVQWLDLKFQHDLQAILQIENQEIKDAGEEIKMIALPDGELLRIRLDQEKGIIKVEVKTRAAYLINGQIRTLLPVTELIYDQDLELLRGAVQVLRISESKCARFYVEDDQVVGLLLQGASFSKTDAFRGPLDRGVDVFWAKDKIAEIFWALKDIEKHFVNPVTDKHYSIILADIESAIHSLTSGRPNADLLAGEALQKAEFYQSRILGNDKVLNSLVSTLKYHLQVTSGRRTVDYGGAQAISPDPIVTAVRGEVTAAVHATVKRQTSQSQQVRGPQSTVNWIKP